MYRKEKSTRAEAIVNSVRTQTRQGECGVIVSKMSVKTSSDQLCQVSKIGH